ncbi:hypothetical protein ACH5RR_040229 [Cinchona calisaya]|uniref:Uncharacterized protein n=1 Tax=Cinchona calisaya TaxID=153742 RepID=A0ABD2XTF6_9GENT
MDIKTISSNPPFYLGYREVHNFLLKSTFISKTWKLKFSFSLYLSLFGGDGLCFCVFVFFFFGHNQLFILHANTVNLLRNSTHKNYMQTSFHEDLIYSRPWSIS